jgi:hypothetical protein
MIYYKHRGDTSTSTCIAAIIYISCALLLAAVAYSIFMLLKLTTQPASILLAASMAIYHITITAISILSIYSPAMKANCVKLTMIIQLALYLIIGFVLIAYLEFYISTLYCSTYVAQLCLQVKQFMVSSIAVTIFNIIANCEITLINVLHV